MQSVESMIPVQFLLLCHAAPPFLRPLAPAAGPGVDPLLSGSASMLTVTSLQRRVYWCQMQRLQSASLPVLIYPQTESVTIRGERKRCLK